MKESEVTEIDLSNEAVLHWEGVSVTASHHNQWNLVFSN